MTIFKGERIGYALLPPEITAPDFTLPDQSGNPVTLSTFRGKIVILVFYPKDASPVCTRQLTEYSTHYPAFEARGAEILAISADDISSHDAFVATCGLSFRLLSDADKSVCRQYEALSLLRTVKRIVYIIDGAGTIKHSLKSLSLFYVSAKELLELL